MEIQRTLCLCFLQELSLNRGSVEEYKWCLSSLEHVKRESKILNLKTNEPIFLKVLVDLRRSNTAVGVRK